MPIFDFLPDFQLSVIWWDPSSSRLQRDFAAANGSPPYDNRFLQRYG